MEINHRDIKGKGVQKFRINFDFSDSEDEESNKLVDKMENCTHGSSVLNMKASDLAGRKKIKQRDVMRKSVRRFQMNFDFSDSDDEDNNKNGNKIKNSTDDTSVLNMKGQTSVLAGSSSICSLSELPSICKDIGLPDAESTCLEHPEVISDDASKSLIKGHEKSAYRQSGDFCLAESLLESVHTTKGESKECIDEGKKDKSYKYKNFLKVNSMNHPSTCRQKANSLDKPADSLSYEAFPELNKRSSLNSENKENVKQITTSKSKLISALHQYCSLHDSPTAEILASYSDEEKQDPCSPSKENDVIDAIPESGSDSDYENQSSKEAIETSQDFHKERINFDLSADNEEEKGDEDEVSCIQITGTAASCSSSSQQKNDGEFRRQSFDSISSSDITKVKGKNSKGLKNVNIRLTFDSLDKSVSVGNLSDHSVTGEQDEILRRPNCSQGKQSTNGNDDNLCESYLNTVIEKKPGRSTERVSKKQHSEEFRYRIPPSEQESDSSDDDNFENFVSQVKTDLKKDERYSKNNSSLEDFIDDSHSSKESDSSNEDEEDDLLFYIKANQKFDKDVGAKSNDSESLARGRLIPHTHTKNERQMRKYSYSSSDDFSPPLSKEREGRKIKGTTGDDSDSLESSIKNLSLMDRINESTARIQFKKPSYVPSLNKTSVATYVPSHSDTDEDDHLTERDDFITPITPSRHVIKRTRTNESDKKFFKTPETRRKAEPIHLMTAPRPTLPSTNEGQNILFLKSLSLDCAEWKRHPEAQRFIRGFKSLKGDLTSKLFNIFNKTVFGNKLPETISLEWSPRYTKTAGTFSYRPKSSLAKITLSVKVCDSTERVRDTLAHELCHAAVRLINGVNESHGRVWKSWARKVNDAFPFMPVVARCHDYTINTKYTYQCVNCKYRVGRHSKSLDTERKICGHCRGHFQLYLTKDLNSIQESPTYTPKAPNKFASYVKEHYSAKKEKNTGMKHGDVMRLLSKEFADKNSISGDN